MKEFYFKISLIFHWDVGRDELFGLAIFDCNNKRFAGRVSYYGVMIDEVCIAQRIEYNNENFVAVVEEGKRTKTVLTFMIQSVSRKYKDVVPVCLLPVNQLNTEFLKK